jgi:threonylcarbamoyladenosine tRNA methylthiotransferase MtaB
MKTRRATVSFKTVGCRLNQAETAVIRASFEEAGFVIVRFGEACDVCVIHGCVVTSKAEEDSLRLARSIKRRYPDAFVILAGCVAEFFKNETRARPEQIDYIAGQKEKFDLPEILGTRLQASSGNQMTGLLPRFDTQRAIVKIQDGCDFHCAYCIVPSVRGASKSRPAADIIKEISKLTLNGFPEIVLTGANIGCYAEGGCNLPQLLEKVEAISGLQRFRISSLEIATASPSFPTRSGIQEIPRQNRDWIPAFAGMTDTIRDVIDFMASSKKMCPFLHFPIQSGSNRILKSMGRPYTAGQFSAVIQYAQKKIGTFGLGTDIIVGFPGETEDDFIATELIIRNLPFSKLHIFSYSPRPGTPASSMPGQVPAKDKEMRSARLIELGRQKRKEFAQSLVGKQVSILVEKTMPGGWAEGWTCEYIWARVKAESLHRKQIAQFVPESAENDILRGTKNDIII